jgi:hypothetical protein
MTKHLLLAAAFCAAALPASACLEGWDCCKWNDPAHQTPKYVIGRILEAYPHTPAGLVKAVPIISAYYPGTTILAGKGDKVHIPCVGTVDLIVAAGGPEGGKAWWWGADEAGNECNKCSPNRCEEVSKTTKCGGGTGGAGAGAGTGMGMGVGGGFGGSGGNCAGVRVPNELAVVQQTASDNPGPWSAKLEPDEAKCRADSRYLDLVVDNLRKKDSRWGFNCKRGDCKNPSHDVVAYSFGQGRPYEGAPQVMLVDMIGSSCAPDARPAWTVLEANFGNGSGAGWTSKGRFASGPHQDVRMNCPLKTEAPTATVEPQPAAGGGSTGGDGGSSPSSSSSSGGSSKPKTALKKTESIGVRNDAGAGDMPTVSSTTVEGEQPEEPAQ